MKKINWKECKTNKDWEVYFKTQLPENNTLLMRAILIIYNLQTASEQEKDRTKERNGVGFNSVDDKILTKIAKKIEYGVSLNDEEIKQARSRMPKYWRQLMIHVKNKQQS